MSDERNKNSDLASVDEHPKHIGPYRILDTLGEGGMSVVYLAEQSEPVKRRVALKILKPGMDSKQVVARFESERQALAVLDHPNIAKIFDGGIAKSGRPYFVMEQVKGVPITDYCDDQRLNNQERLKVFIKVCSAVQHAHLKGLIHRDLKPSNILVGVVDGEPQPKIIDFGIAKATTTTLTDSTLYTRVGQIIGTPQYMSPEQADLTGLDIDTRADIYSLGVVLYELLVGTVPLDLRAIGDHAMQLAIREKEPAKPSTRLTELGDTCEEVAKVRSTDPDHLRQQLKGDLDWIVMHAIEKDRTRRYETANALAMECQRFLNHEPVLARPPSAGYLLHRFVRRNRLTVVAGSIAILAIIAGAALATIGFLQATEAERTARREAETASQVSDFLTELFQVSDPSEARGNSITAREILDRGLESINAGLDDQPEVRATLMLTMAEVYKNLGLLREAEELINDALDVRRQELTAPHDGIAWVLNKLAEVKVIQGEYKLAREYGEEALDMQRTIYDGMHENIGHTLTNLGVVEFYEGNYEGAVELLTESLDIYEQTLGEDDPAAINVTSNLGSVHRRLGNHVESERLGRLALERRRSLSGDDHPDVAVMLGNLAMMLKTTGRHDEAEPMYLKVLELQKKQLGDSPAVANTMNNVGMLYVEIDDLRRAEQMLQGALKMWSQTLGADNIKVGVANHNLAILYINKGDLEQAEKLIERAIGIRTKILGEQHEATSLSRMYLAEIYMDTGRLEEAEQILRRVVEVLEDKLPEGHRRTVSARMRLGATLAARGQIAEGELLMLENLARLRELLPGSITERRALRWVARRYEKWGRPEEAAKYRE